MATPRFRKPKTFGSRSEMSEIFEPKKSFYIICEGEKTENQYFNGVFNNRAELRINQLVDIVVMEQEEGQRHVPHPVHIVDGCVNLIKEAKNSKIEGSQSDLIDYDSSIDEIWVIFDRDPQTFFEEQYQYVYKKCEKYGINIGFTNPTFEFWLLLHLPDINQYTEDVLLANEKVGKKRSKRFVEKQLSSRLKNGYNKNEIQFKRFLPAINLAMEQEKLFKQNVPDILNDVGSNIGVLISRMKKG